MIRSRWWAPAVCALMMIAPLEVGAQDLHLPLPIPLIEQRLWDEPFTILTVNASRGQRDRTQRVGLGFENGDAMLVKWAVAPAGGETFNNVPRYELAAYELQKLFLAEGEFPVPPTAIRAFPLDWYREAYEDNVRPTFDGSRSVFVTFQFWLAPPLAPHNAIDQRRFREDDAYARHFANANVLTYLIRHQDANEGNVLISESDEPRLFVVDNGVAFASQESNRGVYWRDLRINRMPRATAERLKALDRQALESALGVLAQFELRDGQYVRVDRGENLRPGVGIRRSDNVLQFGLTSREIRDVNDRLVRLVRQIDSGRITTF